MSNHHLSSSIRNFIESSRQQILDTIGDPPDCTLIVNHGNIGDDLIAAGTEALLRDLNYTQCNLSDVSGAKGHTALIRGGGGWCGAFQGLPKFLATIEANFERVIILPSTFDTRIDLVRQSLLTTGATIFVRERVSHQMLTDLFGASEQRLKLAHDCAFFFDFSPYLKKGSGTLVSLRADRESAFDFVPKSNCDISVECKDLDEWLNLIAAHEHIITDRAHVAIGGAMLGKRVEFQASNYHKIPAIVDYSLREFPVNRLPDDWAMRQRGEDDVLTESGHIKEIEATLLSVTSKDSSVLIADIEELGHFSLPERHCLPFLEHDGNYWGRPSNSDNAIEELKRMCNASAEFIAFPWYAQWWLQYYTEFAEYLTRKHKQIVANETVIVFDLRQGPMP